MKALTLYEPWATLLVLGEKNIETRPWATNYRGQMAIHAAMNKPVEVVAYNQFIRKALIDNGLTEEIGGSVKATITKKRRSFSIKMPKVVMKAALGCVLGTRNLIDCVQITEEFAAGLSDKERAFGNYKPGRFAWIYDDRIVRFPEPVKTKGFQKLWNWEVPLGIAI